MSPIRFLLRLSLPFLGRMLLAAFLGMATVAAGVGLLSTSAYLIAQAALQPSIAELQVAIVGVRAFGLTRGVLRYLERLVTHDAAFRLLARLRTWVYGRIEQLSPVLLQQWHSGDLLTRTIDDIESLDDFFVRALAPLAVAAGATLAAGLISAQLLPGLGWVVSGAMLTTAAGLSWLSHRLAAGDGAATIGLRARLQVRYLDSLQGLPDLLAFDAARTHRNTTAELEQALDHSSVRSARQRGFMKALPALMTDTCVAACLVALVPMLNHGELEGYLLPVLLLGVMAAFEAVSPLPESFRRLQSQRSAARRLLDICDTSPSIDIPSLPPIPPETHGLVVRGLSFRYPGDGTFVLEGLSFDIPHGTRTAIVGPSGAGKTTLIQILLRLLPYESGSITLGGIELRGYNPADLWRRMGVSLQHPHLYAGTLRENLLLARPEAKDEDLERALGLAQLGHWLRDLPSGLETWIGERGVTLSAGERQRIALARIFLREAPLLLLDEIGAHLDPLTDQTLLACLETWMSSRTGLISTHRLLGLERLVDRILVLEAGRFTARGSHDELVRGRGWYAAAYQAQRQRLELEASDSTLLRPTGF